MRSSNFPKFPRCQSPRHKSERRADDGYRGTPQSHPFFVRQFEQLLTRCERVGEWLLAPDVFPGLKCLPVESFVFELPDGEVAVGIESGAVPVDWWSRSPLEANYFDIAMLTLSADAPPAAPRYPLYAGDDEIGASIVVAGYGVTVHGSVGMDAPDIGLLVGRNRWEVDSCEYLFGLPPPSQLLYDFDSGLEENNVLAWEGFSSDLGFGADEVGSALGDSGGPVFLGRAIAGITSSGQGGLVPDVTSDTDSSWGEVFFDTRVSYFREFLTTATGGQAVFVVPEPTSVWLLMLGMATLPIGRQMSVSNLKSDVF